MLKKRLSQQRPEGAANERLHKSRLKRNNYKRKETKKTRMTTTMTTMKTAVKRTKSSTKSSMIPMKLKKYKPRKIKICLAMYSPTEKQY